MRFETENPWIVVPIIFAVVARSRGIARGNQARP